MRITVNLSIFFHDHRSVAKIFINKHIKCIRDLENRITEIFKINDFYLKCENQYLPSCEDVQILNYDDVVWAVPHGENKSIEDGNPNLENAQITELPVIKKKKKKKKKKREYDEIIFDELPIKKKKIIDEDNHDTKPIKQGNCNIKSEKTSNDKSRDTSSSDSTKNENLDTESRGIKVKSLVDSFENKKIDFMKPLDFSIDKKTNIVKTIIVSNNTPNLASADSTKTDNSNVPQNAESPINCNGDINSDANEVFETECTDVKKRKRKRVRKRKQTKKSPEINLPVHNLIPRPLLTQTSTPFHVRFKDEPTSPEKTANAVKNEVTNVESKIKKEELSVSNIKQEVAHNDDITEEFILKHPVTQNVQPRLGDIIAFKILRISDNYTPEVSSYIVGKVIFYNAENNEITFDITYGEEQCVEPQGKFSVDSEEIVPEEKVTRYYGTWHSLLEPRLLFP